MNVIEIFKRLPRTNCGLCAPRACLPFAVALSRGEADPAACPGLAEDARRELAGARGAGDWRESLIAELRREVAAVPFAEAAPGLGAEVRGEALVVRCLGAEYRIAPDGEVSSAHGPVSPWMRILLLHYVRTRGSAVPAGPWVAFDTLRGAMAKAKAFVRDCEEPLRRLFERDAAAAEEGIRRLGGEPEPGTPAQAAWRILPLPRIPVLLLFWPPEEEFPAQAKILLDASADRFLDLETLLFLVEGLVRTIEGGPGTPLHD